MLQRTCLDLHHQWPPSLAHVPILFHDPILSPRISLPWLSSPWKCPALLALPVHTLNVRSLPMKLYICCCIYKYHRRLWSSVFNNIRHYRTELTESWLASKLWNAHEVQNFSRKTLHTSAFKIFRIGAITHSSRHDGELQFAIFWTALTPNWIWNLQYEMLLQWNESISLRGTSWNANLPSRMDVKPRNS